MSNLHCRIHELMHTMIVYYNTDAESDQLHVHVI